MVFKVKGGFSARKDFEAMSGAWNADKKKADKENEQLKKQSFKEMKKR